MEVHIQSLHIELTQDLTAHIQRQLTLALSRMDQHITAISIILSDVNWSTGGTDKCCQLQVTVVDMGDIVIKDAQTDIYCAIDRAMERASRTMSRYIARKEKQNRHSTTIESIDELDQEPPPNSESN